MANVIRTMKDVDGNTVFPRTYSQAVTIGDGSVNLDGALSNRPEKPSLLPAKTTLADTDLVTIEGTGGVVNKMTVGKLKELLGIQSGGIEESGNNLDGYWIKFKDGTLIMGALVNVPMNDTSVSGIKNAPFPVIPVSIYGGGHMPDYIGNVNYIDALRGLVVAVNNTYKRWDIWPRTQYSGSANINLFLIGRWK